MTFRIHKGKCETCIFTSKSPLRSKERLQDLIGQWDELRATQECHTHTLKDERVACYGQFKAALNGTINYHAFEDAFAEAFPQFVGLDLRLEQKIALANMNGLIEFVGDENDTE